MELGSLRAKVRKYRHLAGLVQRVPYDNAKKAPDFYIKDTSLPALNIFDQGLISTKKVHRAVNLFFSSEIHCSKFENALLLNLFKFTK